MSQSSLQPLGLPFPIAKSNSPEALFAALQAHARANGFAIMQRSKTPTRYLWDCDKGGQYNAKGKNADVHPSKRRRETGTKKTGCRYRVKGKRGEDNGAPVWHATIIENKHNHGPSMAVSAHTAHRVGAISDEIKAEIIAGSRVGQSPQVILSALQVNKPDVELRSKDVYNIIQASRQEQLGGKTPIQWLMQVSTLHIHQFRS